MSDKIVEILWTGGYDSTFRVVQLSRFDIVIQPYYLSDNRDSEKNELNAISAIIDDLQKHPDTKCTINPLQILSKNERVEDQEIADAYHRLYQTDFFGSQYEFLACFAKTHKGIELSIHQDDKAINLINKYGKLKKVSDEIIGENYVLDEEQSPQDLITLFKNYHFPLAQYTKLQMRDFYLKNGYESIMRKTWFCYSPINGKPCGKCNPCRYTMEEGMRERFSLGGKIRYDARVLLNKMPAIKSFVSKLRNR